MKKVLRIFLDTNILIGGPKKKEHLSIRQMAINGNVELYVSHEVRNEQEKHSLDHYYGKYRSEMMKGNLETDLNKIQNVIEEQDLLQYAERQERTFWNQAHLCRIASTFDGLITIAPFMSNQLGFVDIKGEMKCYEELVTAFKIKEKDGAILMSAHSGGCDYFLTWDDKVIKKCERIHWLRMKVINPRDFLREYNPRCAPAQSLIAGTSSGK